MVYRDIISTPTVYIFSKECQVGNRIRVRWFPALFVRVHTVMKSHEKSWNLKMHFPGLEKSWILGKMAEIMEKSWNFISLVQRFRAV